MDKTEGKAVNTPKFLLLIVKSASCQLPIFLDFFSEIHL